MDLQVITHNIGDQETQAVSARELYNFLGIKTQFTLWFDRNVEKYGFVEGEDFSAYYSKTNNSFSKPKIDYALTTDMAKELSMVSKTPKSKEARQYFIAVEKDYKQKVKIKSPLELLQEQVCLALEQEKRLDQVETDIKRIEAKADASTGNTGYFSVLAYCKIKEIKVPVSETKSLGKKAAKLSKNLGITIGKVADERWGLVGSYAEEVLEEVFEEYTKENNS